MQHHVHVGAKSSADTKPSWSTRRVASGAPFKPKVRELVTLVRESVVAHHGEPVFGSPSPKGLRWTTYGELGASIERLRGALVHLGIERGDRVAVISKNRVEWAVTTCAAHSLGAVVVPMYEAQLEKEWAHILRDSGAKVCFVSSDAIFSRVQGLAPSIDGLTQVIGFDRKTDDLSSFSHLLSIGAHTRVEAITPSPEDPAVFIYTSGTTGTPKGVQLSHFGFAANVSVIADCWPMSVGDRAVAIFPWAHLGGVCELFTIFRTGACAALVDGVDTIASTILEAKPTIIAGAPRIWNKFYDAIQKGLAEKPAAVRKLVDAAISAQRRYRHHQALPLSEDLALIAARALVFPKVMQKLGGQLRRTASGAAALSKDVIELFDAMGAPMFEVYGMTEAGICTGNTPSSFRAGSVGRPFPGFEIRIDGSVGEGEDGSGEILIYGPATMLGYRGLPEEDAAMRTPDGGIRSGDLGRLDEDGFLYVTGRIKEVYKLENGKFVSPAPLEEKIALSPFITQALVHGINRPHNVALIVVDVPALTKWCTEHEIQAIDVDAMLAEPRVRRLFEGEIEKHCEGCKGYERVKAFVLTGEELTSANDMLTPTLKVKRRNVLAKYGPSLEALYR